MDVYVIGLALQPASDAIRAERLEEFVQRTSRVALDDAGVTRQQIDHITLAACDELDGRSITSMLLAAPAGGYLKDEMRVTDSGLAGLQLGAMRIAAGDLHLGLVASWNHTSAAPVEDIARMRAEPFYLRPVGINFGIADGLFANAVSHKLGFTAEQAAQRVIDRLAAAASNPRSIARTRPAAGAIDGSPMIAFPLRRGHAAPVTDGAVSMVIASGDWLRRHPGTRPLARIAAQSSGVDSYQLGGERLSGLAMFQQCLHDLLRRAGLNGLDEVDAIELDAQTAWHDLAFTHCLQGGGKAAVSPSGGAWAQNPFFCMGLLNAAEAVLQVAGRSGRHQVAGARRAVAHGVAGYAQQSHGFVLFEGAN